MAQLYTHPDYQRRRAEWEFCRDMYEGDKRVLTNSDYLFYHQVESNSADLTARKIRALREQRTQYLNNSEILVSLWVSYLFRKPMKFDPAALDLLEEIGADQNVDGKGNGFESFFKNVVTPHYLNYGKVIVFCDSYNVKPQSKGQQQALKVRPYLEALAPLSVPDWDIETEETNRIGAYNWLRYEYLRLSKRTATQEPKQQRVSELLSIEDGAYTIKRYVQSEAVANQSSTQPRDQIARSGGDWTLENEIVIGQLDEIPISYIDEISWLKDANYESLRYHNLRSNRDNILHQQGYSKDFIIGLSNPTAEQLKALSEYVWPILPKDCSVTSIGPTDTGSYERALEESLAAVYKVGLNQLRSLPASSKEHMSFDSMLQEKDNTLALVDSGVTDIEKMAQKSLEQLAMMYGVKNFKGTVEMYKDASPMSWDQFIQIFQSARDVFRKYPELETMATKRLVSFMGFSEQDQADAIEVVDNGPEQSAIDKTQEPDPIAAALNVQ